MRTVGIIGGLGPETTSQFYLEIIFESFKEDKKMRPPILIWSVPLEYKIEEDLILKAEGEQRYVPYLIEGAKKLEKAGADFLVIPCNSVHKFIDEVRNSVGIPVLSITEETANFLEQKKIKRVGVLATTSTIKNKLYDLKLKDKNITQVNLDDPYQERIGNLINNLVLNRYDYKDRKGLVKIIETFDDKNVDAVILACTDLQLLVPTHQTLKIYDTMAILAEACVREILKD